MPKDKQPDESEQEPETARTFVAVAADPALRAAISRFQTKLQRKLPEGLIRWTGPEQLHITLKFLGYVERQRLGALSEALAEQTLGLSAFELIARGVGCFPNMKSPRVLWTALAGEVGQLEQAQQKVELAAGEFAQKREDRPFHPHLTLGRVKRPARRQPAIAEAIEELELASKEFGAWRIGEVLLMESKLSPKGASYTVLDRFCLR